jgi:hypothetical protein
MTEKTEDSNDPTLLFFSVAYGVTYAFKVGISETGNYTWHVSTNHWLWVYTIASLIIVFLPAVAAFIFFEVHKGLKNFLGRSFNLVFLFMFVFFPFATFHLSQWVIGYFGGTPNPGILPSCLPCIPSSTSFDLYYFVVYISALVIGIPLLRLVEVFLFKNERLDVVNAVRDFRKTVTAGSFGKKGVGVIVLIIISVAGFQLLIGLETPGLANVSVVAVPITYKPGNANYFGVSYFEAQGGTPNSTGFVTTKLVIRNYFPTTHLITNISVFPHDFVLLSPNLPFPVNGNASETIKIELRVPNRPFDGVVTLNTTVS